MQVTQIAGRKFTTIATLKAFAAEQGMDTTGSSKWVKSQWVEKLESFMEVRAEVVAVAIEVAETIATTEAEAVESALVAAITIEDAAVAVFKALTSPKACAVYRAVLQAVCLAVVFTALLAGKMALWCWDHRSDTAVWCWCEQWLDSPSGKATITRFLIAEWVWSNWVESLIERRDGVMVKVSEVGSQNGDRAWVRLGLGGGAIEIQ